MYINKGSDDQMEICGYKKNLLKTCVTYFFICITAGLVRLVFHWVPHWFLKATSTQCPINEAEFVLITVCNETKQWLPNNFLFPLKVVARNQLIIILFLFQINYGSIPSIDLWHLFHWTNAWKNLFKDICFKLFFSFVWNLFA